MQRVYALNALFVVLATLRLPGAGAKTRSGATPRRRRLRLCGLGAANHTFLASTRSRSASSRCCVEPSLLRRPRQIARRGGGSARSASPYAYLPLRSRADPAARLGRPRDARGAFWAWCCGGTSGRARGRGTGGSAADRRATSLEPRRRARLGRRGARASWSLPGRRRGWPVLLPLLVVLANLAVDGAARLALAISSSGTATTSRPTLCWRCSPDSAARCCSSGCRAPRARVPLVVPAFLLVTAGAHFDRSRYRIAEEFASEVLRSLPPGAHLSASDDNILFVLIYLHLVEGLRPDVDLILQGVGRPTCRRCASTPTASRSSSPTTRTGACRRSTVGSGRGSCSASCAPAPAARAARCPKAPLEGEDDPRVPKDYLTQNLIGHFHYMLGVTFEAARLAARAPRVRGRRARRARQRRPVLQPRPDLRAQRPARRRARGVRALARDQPAPPPERDAPARERADRRGRSGARAAGRPRGVSLRPRGPARHRNGRRGPRAGPGGAARRAGRERRRARPSTACPRDRGFGPAEGDSNESSSQGWLQLNLLSICSSSCVE